MKWYLGIVSSLLFSGVMGFRAMQAVFTSEQSYVEGSVTVNNSRIIMYLNVTDLLESGNLPSGCIINETSGFIYHVHTKWGHASLASSYLMGCNDTFTGGHYDPYGACGPSSDYPYCKVKGGCIDKNYSCSDMSYKEDVYTCEVGDWSGKFGALYVEDGILSIDVQSFGEVSGDQLKNKSIVFHCANNKARAFCATFLNADIDIPMNTTARQSNGYKLMADFGPALGLLDNKMARLTMNYDGRVEMQFNPDVLQGLQCPGEQIAMWIGDAWNDNSHVALGNSSCTSDIYGIPYDPTSQCYEDQNGTDSEFCLSGNLCSDDMNLTYEYNCDCNNDPFSCSPMDLSGRYDLADLITNGLSIEIIDKYMADLTNLVHKSVVLTCVQSNKPLLCAKLQSVGIGKALAIFTNESAGAEGTVTVMDGEVAINISFLYAAEHYLNNIDLPASCFTNGLKAHIHGKWTYNDTNARYGAIACGTAYTGGHLDPWAACSQTTDYISVCKVPNPSPTACVELGGSAGNGKYLCNSTTYQQNPFLCEVGDWSGKYGTYQFLNDFNIQRIDHSSLEVDASDLVGKSVVFHCANDETRAFCAPFLLENNIMDGYDHQPTWPLNSQPGNRIGQALVELDNNRGRILLLSNGYYSVNLNMVNETNCSSSISYAVFTNDTCMNVYDPTIQCLPLSEYNGTLCDSQETCGVISYNCTWPELEYSCSPSDLSGKYGIIDEEKLITVAGWDGLMIPLSELQDKYLGLYCSDTLEIIECQPWDLMNATITEEPVNITEGPIITTAGPITTSEGPVNITEEPVSTTEGPVITTEGPVITTEGPIITTEGPVSTTEGPASTSTTEEPGETTEGPQTTTTTSTTTSTTTEPPYSTEDTGTGYTQKSSISLIILLWIIMCFLY